MDLSWCIMCDCHCIEDNLYCSESCRLQDISYKFKGSASRESTPPASPLLEPFLSSFNHERRTSLTIPSRVSLNDHKLLHERRHS